MANLDSAHDKLCWTSFEDINDAKAELRGVLPTALVEQLDWATLVPLPERFVDDVMRGSQADRLYHVSYRDQAALVYVLWEHKSEVDRWTLLQLLRYMLRIWEHCLAQDPPPSFLPPIIPVIIHHSETGWTAPIQFHGLFEPSVIGDEILRRMAPNFEAVIDDISFAGDVEIRHRGLSPRAMLGLVFLRDGRKEGQILAELAAWADELRALLGLPGGERAIGQLFSYLFRVTPNLDRATLEQRVREVVPETEELVMTLAEQLIQQGLSQGLSQGMAQGLSQGMAQGLSQGMAQGLSQGLSQGMAQGKRGLLRRQLESKFGNLSEKELAQLEAADEATLEHFAERILTATSLSEVLGHR